MTKEKELKEVITALHNAMIGKSMKDHENWILHVLNKYPSSTITNPDSFNVLVNFEFSEMVDSLLLTMQGNGYFGDISEEAFEKTATLFTQFNLIELQLDKVIVEHNSWICSHDKVVAITNAYLSHLRGKEVAWDTKNYWIPDAGTKEQWFELVEGIMDLAEARDLGERAIAARNKIAQAYQRLKESREDNA